MKSLSKEKRDRIILIAVVTLIISVATWMGLVSSQQKNLDHIDRQISEQTGKVDNAGRLIKSMSELQENLDEVNKNLLAIEESMASGDLYSWLILKVNHFRSNRNVDIPQFSRETPTSVGVLPSFPYKAAMFNLRGTAFYHDFGKFVADFENAFPYLRVQNIELESAANSSATSTSDPEKLAFEMEIVALINPNAP